MYEEEKPLKYHLRDGHLLVLTETPEGIEIEMKEGLEIPNPRAHFEQTVTLIEALTRSKADYSATEGGNLRAVIRVRNHQELTKEGLESQLYKNLSLSLIERIEEIEKKRAANTKGLTDDIEHYLNFPLPSLDMIKEYTEISYFVRELYGVIQINTRNELRPGGITRSEIVSETKRLDVAKARHVMMYILYKKYPHPLLSSNKVGAILGTPGKQKNHATVLRVLEFFDPSKGNIPPEDYQSSEYDAAILYKDALEKYVGQSLRRSSNS